MPHHPCFFSGERGKRGERYAPPVFALHLALFAPVSCCYNEHTENENAVRMGEEVTRTRPLVVAEPGKQVFGLRKRLP